MSLSNRKTLLITGGSRGIGAATAVLAAQSGYNVCFSYVHNARAASAIVVEIENRGGHALAVKADLACEADILALFTVCDARFGTLHALVNNAGVLEHQMRLETMTVQRLQRVMSINVIGTMLCAREAVLRMSTKRGGAGGAIVNVSSVASRLGSANSYVDYSASKGAIDTFTIGLAQEVASDGIRVNAVLPGIIDTEIHASGGVPDRVSKVGPSLPMGRVGTAQEVANAIVWLLSEQASYISGSLLEVSGAR
jgi:NAD(P)-dependent dehydrogenase (short-subunit alcohol dehydrogenase family)